jgi:hypothetical protein
MASLSGPLLRTVAPAFLVYVVTRRGHGFLVAERL